MRMSKTKQSKWWRQGDEDDPFLLLDSEDEDESMYHLKASRRLASTINQTWQKRENWILENAHGSIQNMTVQVQVL